MAIPPALTEAQIRECAYYLWLERGQPDGRDLDIWLDAEARLQSIAAPAAGNFPPPRRSTSRRPRLHDHRPEVARSGAAQRRRAHHPPTTQVS